MAVLARRALAEVSTVPVLLGFYLIRDFFSRVTPGWAAITRIIITDCGAYLPPVTGHFGCCRTYLEQSASTRHLRILTSSLQSMSEDPSRFTCSSHITVNCPCSDSRHFGHFGLLFTELYCITAGLPKENLWR